MGGLRQSAFVNEYMISFSLGQVELLYKLKTVKFFHIVYSAIFLLIGNGRKTKMVNAPDLAGSKWRQLLGNQASFSRKFARENTGASYHSQCIIRMVPKRTIKECYLESHAFSEKCVIRLECHRVVV